MQLKNMTGKEKNMWWHPKIGVVEEEDEETCKYMELTVNFKGGAKKTWRYTTPSTKVSMLPFKEFVKWYHSREQSKAFTMCTNREQFTMLRENIYSFDISLEVFYP